MSEVKATLNAIGKTRSASYSPDYKLKGTHTSVARLRRPYGPSMKFVDDQQREIRQRRTRRPKPAPLLDLLSIGERTP